MGTVLLTLEKSLYKSSIYTSSFLQQSGERAPTAAGTAQHVYLAATQGLML